MKTLIRKISAVCIASLMLVPCSFGSVVTTTNIYASNGFMLSSDKTETITNADKTQTTTNTITQYDSFGRPATVISTPEGGVKQTTVYNYNADGSMNSTVTTSGNGQITTDAYSQNGEKVIESVQTPGKDGTLGASTVTKVQLNNPANGTTTVVAYGSDGNATEVDVTKAFGDSVKSTGSDDMSKALTNAGYSTSLLKSPSGATNNNTATNTAPSFNGKGVSIVNSYTQAEGPLGNVAWVTIESSNGGETSLPKADFDKCVQNGAFTLQ